MIKEIRFIDIANYILSQNRNRKLNFKSSSVASAIRNNAGDVVVDYCIDVLNIEGGFYIIDNIVKKDKTGSILYKIEPRPSELMKFQIRSSLIFYPSPMTNNCYGDIFPRAREIIKLLTNGKSK